MHSALDRFIFKEDFAGQDSWNLLDWCAMHGADEFSVAMLSLQGSTAPFLERAEKLLEAFVLPPAPREFVIGRPLIREAPLWALNSESITALKRLFPEGLFMYPTSEWEEGCLEDPTFYRHSALLLGVVSHEGEGRVSVTEGELSELEHVGYKMFSQSKWL
jgi:hypothetical protein